MDIGAFTFPDPVPKLRRPHAIAMLRPWIDVGGVGAAALDGLERTLPPTPLGQLTTAGRYLDFTRYRPSAYFKEGVRQVDLPNSYLRYAEGPGDHDFIFMHLLEPHANGEEYVDSLLEVFAHFSVARYALIGAMYDMVPHTRPLLISGSASDSEVDQKLKSYGARPSRYEGPTTIMTLLPAACTERGIETMSMLARLPQYAPLDEDHAGALRILTVLGEVYGLTLDFGDMLSKAEEQLRQISLAVAANPQLQRAVTHLEERYDARHGTVPQENLTPAEPTPLPPAIEQFLRELGS